MNHAREPEPQIAGMERPPRDWRSGARIALHAAARRTDLWPLALVSFLFRGGILVVVLPIVVLPTTVGIATFVGPTTLTPTGPAPEFVRLAVSVAALVIGWLVAGGLIAAGAEAVLVRDSLGRGRSSPAVSLRLALRILRARSVAALPLVLAVGWSIPRLVGATYEQLIRPSDPAIALPIRVLETVPGTLAVILVAWLLSEALGGLAVRRVVLIGEGAFESTWRAVLHLVAHPVASLATIALGLAFTAALLLPAIVAAAIAWGRLGLALERGAAIEAVLLAVAFVAIWATGLLAAGAGSTWRGVAWTVEVVRARRVATEAPATDAVSLLGAGPAIGSGAVLVESEVPSGPS